MLILPPWNLRKSQFKVEVTAFIPLKFPLTAMKWYLSLEEEVCVQREPQVESAAQLIVSGRSCVAWVIANFT